MMGTKISNNSVVVAVENQVSSELDEEVVILELESGVYYGLNSVGASIWGQIQEPKTVEQLQEYLLEEYEVEPERCARELATLLEQLADKGLVKISDGSTP